MPLVSIKIPNSKSKVDFFYDLNGWCFSCEGQRWRRVLDRRVEHAKRQQADRRAFGNCKHEFGGAYSEALLDSA